MHLVIGLGNPGSDYEGTRHNAGFMVLDRIAERAQCGFVPAGRSLVCRAEIAAQTVLLAKPLTYMNRSGSAIPELLEQLSNSPELLVVYDEVALPLGVIRLRRSGSSGGQKGMQSILDQFGTNEIPRLRVGVGPVPNKDTSRYVLSRFTSKERVLLEEILDRAAQAVECVIKSGVEPAMSMFNTRSQVDPEQPDAKSESE